MIADPWSVLGVARDASSEDIKAAYKRLAREHHPDLGGDQEKFIAINQAYEQLANPKQNTKNHATNQHAGSGPFGDFADLNDIFRHFGNPFRSQQFVRNPNLEVLVQIALNETISGATRTLQVNEPGGSREIQIEIPRGVGTGDTMKYANMGSRQRADLPPGDLYVRIQVQMPQGYDLVQGHLLTHRDIGLWQALVGSTVKVSDPYGVEIEVTVPPLSRPGTTLRVAGRGGFQRATQQRGDILVELGVNYPDQLTPEQTKIIQDWH